MATRRRSKGDWPEELVKEILLRLPVKSILRFNCVAKTWYDRFKTPSFISQHHTLSKRNTSLLLARYANWINLFDAETLAPYNGFRPQLPPRVTPFNDDDVFTPLPPCLAHYNIDDLNIRGFNFCVDNGLVCLWDKTNSEISLWNPATREFRVLPRATFFVSYIGFGFDPISNDYKAVCLNGHILTPPIFCAVYNMSSDSWRVMNEEEVDILTNTKFQLPSSICVNGVCYWLLDGEHSSPIKKKLLAFHLGYEAFEVIDLPPGKCDGRLLISSYNDRDRICFACTDQMYTGHERLALTTDTFSMSVDTGYEIWMLNDEGHKHWTKLLTIEDPPFRVDNIFRFWGESKVLASVCNKLLVLWDIETNEWERVQDFASHLRAYRFEVCPYQESLVATNK